MEEEEEDRALLSRLGVTSANPEDIERDILTKAKNDIGYGNQSENSAEEQDGEHGADLSSTARTKLYNKLRAVEIEIDAVAASIEESKEVAKNESEGEDVDIKENEDAHYVNGCVHVTTDGLTLQQALATDRLRSLQKTRAQLQKEIARLDEDIPVKRAEQSELLDKLVKEAPRQKHKKKDVQQSVVNLKKQKRVAYNEDVDFDAALDAASGGFVETEREELVRKGILTPFHRLKGFERGVQQPPQSSRQSVSEEETFEVLASSSIAKVAQSLTEIARTRPTSKLLDAKDLPKLDGPTRPFQRLGTPIKCTGPKHAEDAEKKKQIRKLKRPLPEKKWRKSLKDSQMDVDDDAKEGSVASEFEEENQQVLEDATDEESCVILEGGLKIPDAVFSKLFDYQKVGVQWLWELHCQRAGGIIGDEMGLGKTIQVIAFLSALHFSKMYKPSIVICPLTLLRQWQRETMKWYPKFHVEILHDSAQSSRKKVRTKSSESDDESASLCSDEEEKVHPVKSTRRWDDLINRVIGSESGLLLTTYEQLRILGDKLLDIEWGYAILDEGHRIRNPNADVTLICKQLQTVHRIIMTGAPIQNKLSELWSLFDFVFPGKLGVLPVFEAEFAVPITVGGYANATPLQVSTAYRCAVVLRDLIMPYLLRRMKADVDAQLPKKTEHVLFCSLTSDQRSIYRAFLASTEVEQIFDGSRNSLYGIDVMRKICNHPDLLEREHSAGHPDYGNPERSGKMKVVAQILTVWKEQGHRVLLFTQTQQMLDIIENFLSTSGYVYRRLDGLTPVKQRMALIDEFNNSTEVFIFILTTKVGGLGTNLTGANRVIIYDPDWNPSTDMQARERAWRIGQTKDVTIYRLITRGTIEEKVYHRQIYKHFLTNKILKNPQQKRFFKARDMRDLFTLHDDGETGSTETSKIFKELSEDVNIVCGKEQNNHEPQETNGAVKRTRSAVEKPKSESQGKEKPDESSGKLDEDANILKSLFDAQGIHSAVNHDAIMNANDEDKRRMEQQASLVAQRAAEALRQSRMLRSRDSISVPTWTGRSGAAGAPSSVQKKFGSTVNSQLHGSSSSSLEGPSSRHSGVAVGMSTGKVLSSAELLARIRGTQEKAAGEGLEHQLCQSSGSSQSTQIATTSGPSRRSNKHLPTQPEVLIRQLCTFIQQRGGSTESSCIVKNFKDKIPAKDLPLFRNLLKEIATLVKDSSGSRWVLKPDYR